MCFCNSCLTGAYINCFFEPGVQVCSRLFSIIDSDSESESDDEIQNDNAEEEHEEQQLRDSCILELLECGQFIALYSPPSASELFYLRKVLVYGVASGTCQDIYQHTIPKGIKCQYLEKKSEKKNKIFYRLLPNKVFILPPQVMSPLVPIKDNLYLSTAEYQ